MQAGYEIIHEDNCDSIGDGAYDMAFVCNYHKINEAWVYYWKSRWEDFNGSHIIAVFKNFKLKSNGTPNSIARTDSDSLCAGSSMA